MKLIKMYIMLTLAVLSGPAFADNLDKKISITIQNYTLGYLNFNQEIRSVNSKIELPENVSRGIKNQSAKAIATIHIKNKNQMAEGGFIIGYDDKHFCKYAYSYDPQSGASWFMYAQRSTLDNVSCSVDADVHTFIVFQKMG